MAVLKMLGFILLATIYAAGFVILAVNGIDEGVIGVYAVLAGFLFGGIAAGIGMIDDY